MQVLVQGLVNKGPQLCFRPSVIRPGAKTFASANNCLLNLTTFPWLFELCSLIWSITVHLVYSTAIAPETVINCCIIYLWNIYDLARYMFFVNIPYLPEWFFSSGDLKMLENAFQGRGMGAKPGAFTRQDMEAFKHIFNTPSKICQQELEWMTYVLKKMSVTWFACHNL